MKFLLIYILLAFNFLLANITNYKVDMKKDNINLILYFDKALKKDIKYSRIENTNIIIINDKISFKNTSKKINNDLFKELKFIDVDDKTNILFSSKNPLNIDIKKINKNLALKIIFSKNKNPLSLISEPKSNAKIQLKEPSVGYKSYLLSFFIIVVILIIYWILKTRVLKMPSSMDNAIYKVIFQKSLDMKTKISLVQVQGKKYLILTGVNHSILLDTFDDIMNDINKEGFDKMVEGYSNKKSD